MLAILRSETFFFPPSLIVNTTITINNDNKILFFIYYSGTDQVPRQMYLLKNRMFLQ